jgi:predicted RNA-binding Zn ribbon-like protein
MFFLDTSRNRTRTWCDMAACGNRAKAAAYYQRHSRKHVS